MVIPSPHESYIIINMYQITYLLCKLTRVYITFYLAPSYTDKKCNALHRWHFSLVLCLTTKEQPKPHFIVLQYQLNYPFMIYSYILHLVDIKFEDAEQQK